MVGRGRASLDPSSPVNWLSLDDFLGGLGRSATAKDLLQLLRRNNFELRIGAVGWLLVRAPSAELCRMSEAVALHVVVSHLDHQLGSQWLPGQILAVTPAALGARDTMPV